MANPEHLKLAQKGPEAIRKWWKRNGADEDACLDLRGADLSGRFLREIDFFKSDLRYANLSGAELYRAEFTGANLERANLSQAFLNSVSLSDADLREANLSESYLTNTTFIATLLDGADFSKARFGHTVFEHVDLSNCLGLEEVIHLGPSMVGTNTLLRSIPKVPRKFLKNCGIPEPIINIYYSLASKTVKFHSCFISFTEADDVFSQRLYEDLQSVGVPCWRWREDAKWGRTLIRSIDEAVHQYEKIIVICSEQSLNSPGVIREIERALQKEDELIRQTEEGEVLFPIRLDDYIFSGWQHYRKADVLAKNIADFRGWNRRQFYRKALDRLIRDLRINE
jgi:hypothetical protein